MNDPAYLIVHKDHPLTVRGVNSGAETATLCLAFAMAKLGKRVIVAAQLAEGGDTTQDGVEFWDLGAEFEVGKALERADAVGSYHLISGGRAQPILESRSHTNCLSRTLICHDPSSGATGVSPKIISSVCDQVISVSEAQRQLFVQNGAIAEKVVVVHNGAELDLFKAGDPSKRDYKRLVFVGALVQDKGIHVLLNAFSQLQAKYRDLKLDVYGSASMWKREELFDQKAIEAQLPGVKFHGAVPRAKVAEAFGSAGVCVIPSIWFDSFPLTAVEAQVCGCPVVGFDNGGIKEAIESGKTGEIIPEVSQELLTKTLDRLLSEPNRLRQMSEQALTLARARYDWSKVATTVCQLCERAAHSNNLKPGTETGTNAGTTSPHRPPLKTIRKRVAVLSTWNQHCGLATYARYMLSQFDSGSYVVLAEDTDSQRCGRDEPFVTRCWKRGSADFEALRRAIKDQDIGLLQLNCHYSFFPQPQFGEFLNQLRREGIKVAALIHNPYTLDGALQQLVQSVDCTIVHTPENALEIIANGGKPCNVKVVPHGVHVRQLAQGEMRTKLGMPHDQKVLVSFGFVQPHKGMEGLIEGIAQLRAKGVACCGYIVGKPMVGDPNSESYLAQLKDYAQKLGVAQWVTFVSTFIDDDQVSEYLAAADVVLMNYRSQHYEASGACSLAVGAGAVVAASIAPPFAAFGDAVWHITSGFPAAHSLEALVCNETLRNSVRNNARRYAQDNCWAATRQRLDWIYSELGFEALAQSQPKEGTVMNTKNAGAAPILRVLMQNRPTAMSHRGGDTVLMERLRDGLTARGCAVIIDLEGREDPKGYDLVHLFNFATPELTRALAERAWAAKVPYVVSTLYEDIPCFHSQSRVWSSFLVAYVGKGQDANWYESNLPDLSKIPGVAHFDNAWTAEHAAGLFPNGRGESRSLKRDYPNCGPLYEVKLGYELGATAPAELFIKEYGIKDFVLCVGRLESRKNQLALLKALEHSDLPVVLAAGGFSYQPEFEAAVRAFKRKGRTLVLGRLSDQMLASAYAAARVHVLPSWYELPGLVSLEAAMHGCNVVVTRNGTASDYLGDRAFYCRPDDLDSIYNSTLAAYYSPYQEGLKEVVMRYSWETVADETMAAYRDIMARAGKAIAPQSGSDAPSVTTSAERVIEVRLGGAAAPSAALPPKPAEQDERFNALMTQAEEQTRQRNYTQALELMTQAEKLSPDAVRLHRTRGAAYMADSKVSESQACFERALQIAPKDSKSLVGRGMCDMMNGKRADAYAYFVRALDQNPSELIAIHQLVECSFAMGIFHDLRRVLERYLKSNPNDVELRFCLAGCYFKLDERAQAESTLSEVLKAKPGHNGALQLRAEMAKGSAPEMAKVAATPAPSAVIKASAPAPVMVSASKKATYPDIDRLEGLKRDKKYDEVKSACDGLIKNPQTEPGKLEAAKVLRGDVAAIERELDKAADLYEQVLAANPQNARALCGKGALAAHGSRLTEAQELFTKALQLDAQCDVALAGLGVCSGCAGNREQAWDYYVRALAINPENMRALLGIIEQGYALNRPQQIENLVRGYLERHPVEFNFLYALAGALFAQNKLQEAVEELDKILLFEPTHVKALELRQVIEGKQAGGERAAG